MAITTHPQHDGIWDAPIVSIAFLVLLITGAVDVVLDGDLSKGFTELLKAIDLPMLGVALGRGWAARKAG